MKNWLACIALAALPSLAADAASVEQLRFLVGSWNSVPGADAVLGHTGFRLEVKGHVMVRDNRADYPAAAGKPPVSHEDLMVIYAEGSGPLKAIYFDNEGHVIRYTAAALDAKSVTFVSDPVAGQPRFRLTYAASAPDRLSGEFASAPPDAPGKFKPMFTWDLRKVDVPALH
ncbi:MAG TPA: hypothetical protein VNU21_24005 [Usitatibacter sp.]|nr:hypothetical protein [Usitatibacter sp.]